MNTPTISPNEGEREPSLGMPAPAMHASFIAAYYRACDSSQPGDWFDAALAAKQWEYSVRATLAAVSPDGAGVLSVPETINGEAPNAHNILAALIDIHDDAETGHPDERCYVPEAWGDTLRMARRFLAAPQARPEPSKPISAIAEQLKWQLSSLDARKNLDLSLVWKLVHAATPQPAPSVQPPAEASETLRRAAQEVCDAYENRFESLRSSHYTGPIDEEMKALAAHLRAEPDAGNAKDVAERLVREIHEGIARKDWEAWAREASVTMQRLATPQPPAPVVPLPDAPGESQ